MCADRRTHSTRGYSSSFLTVVCILLYGGVGYAILLPRYLATTSGHGPYVLNRSLGEGDPIRIRIPKEQRANRRQRSSRGASEMRLSSCCRSSAKGRSGRNMIAYCLYNDHLRRRCRSMPGWKTGWLDRAPHTTYRGIHAQMDVLVGGGGGCYCWMMMTMMGADDG